MKHAMTAHPLCFVNKLARLLPSGLDGWLVGCV